LRKTFSGFQGQDIATSDVVIISKDANWQPTIRDVPLCDHEFFREEIAPYLTNFNKWLTRKRVLTPKHQGEKTPIHHPLLLPSHDVAWSDRLAKPGWKVQFHHAARLFFSSLLETQPEIISKTCFTEFLPAATAGQSGSDPRYFEFLQKCGQDHLKRLRDDVLNSDRRRIVFLALGNEHVVARLQRDDPSKHFFEHLDYGDEFPSKNNPVIPICNSLSKECEVWGTLHLAANERYTVAREMAKRVLDFYGRGGSS
jgi:hypothetical protein